MATIEVSGDVLRWARNRVSLSPEDVAERLKVSPDRVEGWEKGSVRPTVGALEKLAKLYGRPVAVLLLENPPPPETLPPDYRTVAGRPASETRDLLIVVRRVKKWRQTAAKLANATGSDLSENAVPRFRHDDEPEALAPRLRERLEVTAEDQLDWPNVGHALATWRDKVESLGVVTFSVRMKRSVCRGFSMWSPDPPSVIALATESPQAKIFTLFHEVGHLTLRQGGICLEKEDQTARGRVERFCNRLAAAVLMPPGITRSLADQLFGANQNKPKTNWSVDEVSAFARRLHVSIPALALRLEELELAPTGLFDALSQPETADDEPPKGGGARWPGVKIAEMGSSYSQVVYQSWQQGLITTADAAVSMNMPPKYVPLLGEALARRRTRLAE